MDDTTDTQIMQGELTPEEAKASLGLSTRLSEQFLMQQMAQDPNQVEMGAEAPLNGSMEQPEAPQAPQEPQGEELEPKVEEDAPDENQANVDDFKRSLTDELRGVVERAKDEIITELKDKEDGE